MDKIRQQKFEQFLLQKDQEIREMNNYSLLERGAGLLNQIDQFEDENAEFLQQNGEFQDELNKRKCTINFILFPIISDEKVEELLQYHLVDAFEVNLDVELLMKQRAITASELLWPKLAQQYIKSISQNTQLIGGEPLVADGEKSSFLPYVKNWISLYNRRFGIEKHSGLEIHQFVIENINTKKLTNKEKEILIKVLSFYESLKVYSLSEIENEMKKISQSLANSISTSRSSSLSKEEPQKSPTPVGNNTKPDFSFPRDKIKFKTALKEGAPTTSTRIMVENSNNDQPIKENTPSETKPTLEIEKGPILELIEKYPSLKDQRITQNSISLKTAPFNLTPTVWNWIKYYFDECGKGRHQKEERERFIETIKSSQSLTQEETQIINRIYLSLDEKIEIPIDKNGLTIITENVGVGNKMKQNFSNERTEKEAPPTQFSSVQTPTENNKRGDDLEIELIATGKPEEY